MNKRLWRALLAAAVVCVLVVLLVVGCTQRGPAITAQGVTNLDSLTLRDYLDVGKRATFAGEMAVANGLVVTKNLTGTSSTGVVRYATGMFTKTVETNSISVTTGITAATIAVSGPGNITGNLTVGGELTAANGAIYVGGESFLVPVYAGNGLRVTENLTGTAAAGMLRYGAAVISSTLDTNSISVTTGITVATMKVTGSAQVTGELSAGNGILAGGNVTGTSSAGILRYGAAVISSTLDTNAISVTTGITAATAAISGAARVTGTMTLGTFLQATSGVSQTVVNTQPITPTATYQTIAAAVNVFTDNLLRAGAVTGQLWILQNIGTPTVTITDANTCNLASTYAMGISDTLGLLFDGTSWVEIFRSDN